MNYKEAYCHILCQLDPIIEGLEQPQPTYTHIDAAAMLKRLRVESEEILIGQGLLHVHRAPRKGSSLNTK